MEHCAEKWLRKSHSSSFYKRHHHCFRIVEHKRAAVKEEVDVKGKGTVETLNPCIVSEMSHYTTTLSSINFSLAAYTTFLNLENINNLTFSDINATTTLVPVHHGPPSSPYNLTQRIIIAIVFTILALLTVIGNFMVSL